MISNHSDEVNKIGLRVALLSNFIRSYLIKDGGKR